LPLLRIVVVSLSLAGFGTAVAGPAEKKTTNWRIEYSTEIEKTQRLDSLIKPKEPSLPKAQEKIDTLCSQLKRKLAEQVPATFFSNPPYVGEVAVTVVLKQKVSFKLPGPRDVSRAADITESIRNTGRFPSGDVEVQRQKETEAVKGKAKEYIILGLRIVLKDATGREVLNSWCQAEQSGKVKIKKCAREIVNVMRLVAARSESPGFQKDH
jgi:hypothetical protein